MRKIIPLLFLLSMAFPCVTAQAEKVESGSLTLQTCQQLARENYPAVRRYALLDASEGYTLENAARGWLPQIGLNASAAAFTDILKDNAMLSQAGVDMKNYALSASAVVQQRIYDGGQTAVAKATTQAQTDVSRRELDAALYDVQHRVEQIYFALLLVDEQISQNANLQNDLAVSFSTVENLQKGGLASESDLDAVRVEQERALQQHDVFLSQRAAYVRMLGVFLGKELSADVPLEKPVVELAATGERPELRTFNARNALLNVQRKSLDAKLRPTLGFFGGALVHNDVTALIRRTQFAAGLTLSWNIAPFYTRRNDLHQLELNRAMNENAREEFLFSLRLQSHEADGTIASLRKQISHDAEIVRLREQLCRQSAERVKGGTETVNEYLRKVNASHAASLQKALHETQLLQAIYQLKYIHNS